MKSDRPASVCSDSPSSPESLEDSDNSPVPSPPPIMPDPYIHDHDRIYSPYPSDENITYNFPPSPAYSTDSLNSFDFQQKTFEDFPPVNTHEDFEKQTEFMRAVEDADQKEVRRILTKYSQCVQVNGFTGDGQTALTQSCVGGNIEIVKLLVSHGASVHLTNRDGFSPLHIACWFGKVEVMKFLLRASSHR